MGSSRDLSVGQSIRVTTITISLHGEHVMEAAKRTRTNCLKNFTRSVKSYNELHAKELPLDLLTQAFDKVQLCFGKLEGAQDNYIEVADTEEDVDYLEEPSERHQNVLITYGEYKKKCLNEERTFTQNQLEVNQKADEERRAKERQDAIVAEAEKTQNEKDALYSARLAEFQLAIDAFSRMNLSIKGVVQDASDTDKRDMLGKLEADFQDVRKKLVALETVDSAQDTKEYKDSFVDNVEKPFVATQKWFLGELKDSVVSSAPLSSSASASSNSNPSVDSNTKREPVTLPSFKGDLSSKPSPYLQYPVWRKRWDAIIKGYDSKFHANFLLDRLDDSARLKELCSIFGWLRSI